VPTRSPRSGKNSVALVQMSWLCVWEGAILFRNCDFKMCLFSLPWQRWWNSFLNKRTCVIDDFSLAIETTKRQKSRWILANWQTLSDARTEATFILNLFTFSNTAQVNNKGTKQSNCRCCAVLVDYVRHDRTLTFRQVSLVPSSSVIIFSQPQKNAVNNSTNRANPSLFDDDYPPVDFLLSQKAADLLYSNRDIDVTLETSTLFCASNQLRRQLVNYLFYFACQRGRKVRHSKWPTSKKNCYVCKKKRHRLFPLVNGISHFPCLAFQRLRTPLQSRPWSLQAPRFANDTAS